MQVNVGLPIGTPVIYYHRWNNFETDAFEDQFEPLSPDEIRALKAGDVIYVDIDPLHPHGKVYGWIKARVIEVSRDEKSGVSRIHFYGGQWRGFKSTDPSGNCRAILRAKSEAKVAEISARLPKSAVV